MTSKINQIRARLTNGSGSWLSRIGAAAVLAVAIIVGAALSAFLFGFFLVLAAVAGLWLWWQQWRLKRKLRRRAAAGASAHTTREYETRVIQGEYEVVDEETARQDDDPQSHDPHRSKTRQDDRPRAERERRSPRS